MQRAGRSLRCFVSADGPNPIRVAITVLQSQLKRRPRPGDGAGATSPDGTLLARVLESLRVSGVAALPDTRRELADFRDASASIDPDDLDRDAALAYWLNLYNAGALDLAAHAAQREDGSVLRIPGGFSNRWVTVAGEALSLSDIEHGKVRRFKDPRIHGALVCGSASCPTLRYEPFRGEDLDTQLDDQLRSFLAGGGAVVSGESGTPTVMLSRVLLWYGNDFARPHRMPAFIPSGKKAVAVAIEPWLPEEARSALAGGARVDFQPYDWSLACAVG